MTLTNVLLVLVLVLQVVGFLYVRRLSRQVSRLVDLLNRSAASGIVRSLVRREDGTGMAKLQAKNAKRAAEAKL